MCCELNHPCNCDPKIIVETDEYILENVNGEILKQYKLDFNWYPGKKYE